MWEVDGFDVHGEFHVWKMGIWDDLIHDPMMKSCGIKQPSTMDWTKDMGRSTNKTWEFRHKHGNVSYTKQAFGSNQQEVQISKGYLKTAAIIFQPCRLHWLELQTWDDLAMSPGFYEFTHTHTYIYIYQSYIYDTISFESFSLHPDTTKLQATVFTDLCRTPVVHTTGQPVGSAQAENAIRNGAISTQATWDLGVGPMAPSGGPLGDLWQAKMGLEAAKMGTKLTDMGVKAW